mmetsp:Transcript_4345/g.12545  ORF Transcript_4345/g.12545 Transcript_4345/m.12545 type:complete len:360 (+) Transcript_4345:271-1350(+)
MSVGGLPQGFLQEGDALPEGGAARLDLGEVRRVLPGRLRVLRMGGLQGSKLLGMLVRRVTDQCLHVVHALVHRRVVLVQRLQLLQVLPVLPVRRCQLGVRLVDRLDLLPVLVRRVPNSLLQVVDALLYGGVVLARRAQAVDGLHVLALQILDRLKLAPMLVCGVAQQLLQIVQPALDVCVALRQGLGSMHVLLVRRLQGLELCCVLLGRIAELALYVGHALGKRHLGDAGLGHLRQVRLMLVLRRLQRLHVCGVLVGAVAKDLFQVRHALLDAGVNLCMDLHLLRVPGRCLGVHRVRRLQGLDLLFVFVGGVPQQLLNVGEALAHVRVHRLSALQHRKLLCMFRVHLAELIQLLTVLLR